MQLYTLQSPLACRVRWPRRFYIVVVGTVVIDSQIADSEAFADGVVAAEDDAVGGARAFVTFIFFLFSVAP
jgi:hypothetical protein